MIDPNSEIPLYSVNDEYIGTIKLADAQEKFDAHEILIRGDGRGKNWRPTSAKHLHPRRDLQSKRSHASITHSEMMAHAGVYGRSRTMNMSERTREDKRTSRGLPEEDFIERAVNKISVWKETGDTLAVRV